jgi:hypothetical protein
MVSDNKKPGPATPGEAGAPAESQLSLDTSQLEAAEARMRRALGLNGVPRTHHGPPAADHPEAAARQRKFTPGPHRRRFAQDGDIPTTFLRRDTGEEGQAPSRLEAAEAALTHETTARERAERALQEAQAHIHDLQTKLGHAELARQEALQAAERERQATAALRSEMVALRARLEAPPAPAPQPESAEMPRRGRGRPRVREKAPAPPRETLLKETPLKETPKPQQGVTTRKAKAAEREPKPVKWWIKPRGTRAKQPAKRK